MITDNSKKILILVVLLVVFCLPKSTVAVDTQSYVPLAPIPGATVSSDCSNNPGDPNYSDNCKTDISQYIPGAVRVIIEIAGALAVIMIVIGGIQYISTDAISGKEDGKDKIKNAIYGLLLALAAFVILQTINPGTLSLNLNLSTGGTPPPSAPSTPTASTGKICKIAFPCAGDSCLSKTSCNAGDVWQSDYVILSNARLNEDQLKAGFASAGIAVAGSKTNLPCTYVGQDGCTSLVGLPDLAVQKLLDLKKACGCSITITGGTEFWAHQTHGPGMARVDLRLVSGPNELNSYITGKGEEIPTSSKNGCYDGQPAWKLAGQIFVLEKNTHWHICFSY